MQKNESGNVIFYVLIAVALLAALSYTVAGSLRGGTEQVSEEKTALEATDIFEYANTLSSSISQLRLRGIKAEDISFENGIVSGYENPNCTTAECKVFDVQGAGVTYQAPNFEWLDVAHNTQPRFGELYFNAVSKVSGAGTDADDLVLMIPYVRKELCKAINSRFAIMPTGAETPKESSGPANMNAKFVGVYDTTVDTEISGAATTGNGAILQGKPAGCTEASGGGSNAPTGTYHFYKVLISR